MIPRKLLAMTLLAELGAVPAIARDCERGSDTGSSRGCVLDLGRFPLLLPGLPPAFESLGAALSAVLERLGDPLSTNTSHAPDPREPEVEIETVTLSYPAFMLE